MSFIKPNIEGLDLSFDIIEKSTIEEKNLVKTLTKQNKQKFFDQIETEKNYLSQHYWDSETTIETALEEYFKNNEIKNINKSEKSKYELYDFESLKKLAAIADNFYLFESPNFRTGYSFIKKTITNLKLIGSSSYGHAMVTSLYERYKDIMVIKTPIEFHKYTNIAINHELVVGKILNQLRPIIPNFMYTFGSFQCGSPITDPFSKSSEVTTWCRGGKKATYIMLENISNSESLYFYVKKCNEQDYLNIILQITYALAVAYKTYGFTHYDLHANNILIREIDGTEGSYIPYLGDFILVNKLAMIIDYGFSHVKIPEYNDESVGHKDWGYNFDHTGIFYDKPFPLKDIYDLIYGTLNIMKHYNNEVYQKVKGLMYFFFSSSVNIDTIFENNLNKDIPYFGISEYTKKISKFKHESFIKFCREYCIINDLEDPVISGKNYQEMAEDLDQYILMPSVNPIHKQLLNDKDSVTIFNKKINSIEEIFDVIEPILIYKKYLEESKNIDKIKSENLLNIIKKIFKTIISQKDYLIQLLEEEIKNTFQELSNIKVIYYYGFPDKDPRNITQLRKYYESIKLSLKYIEKVEFYEKKIEMIEFVSLNVLKNENEKINSLKDLLKQKDERKIMFNFMREDLVHIKHYLESLETLDKIDKIIFTISNNIEAICPQKE